MKVYIVVAKETHEFCNVYATRELALKYINQYPKHFLIFEENVIDS